MPRKRFKTEQMWISRTVKEIAHVQIDNNLDLFAWLFKTYARPNYYVG